MYFRLDCYLNPSAGLPKEEDNIGETLLDGKAVDQSEIILPWPFTLTRIAGALKPSDYYSGSNLMSKRLVETIQACGVTNLQLFPAVITREDSREGLPDYLVVNIVGLIAAADMASSKSRPLADVQFFEKLVLDPSQARGLLMFRLAESRADVIVAAKVAQAIQAGGFVDVTLEPLG